MKPIKVHGAHDELVGLDRLQSHPRNPNKHPQEQIELLGEIIRSQGWRAPITVSNLSGFITRGHGRLAAAKLIGAKKAPVDFQDYSSEESELADMVADNKIAELS